MDRSARLVGGACHELDEDFLAAKVVWRDATAEHYGERFHKTALEVLRRYVRAAERLELAIERAEST